MTFKIQRNAVFFIRIAAAIRQCTIAKAVGKVFETARSSWANAAPLDSSGSYGLMVGFIRQ